MKVTMKQHMKDIYQLTVPTPFLVGPVNTYLIRGEALTLVDAGPKTEEARYQLESQLAELNVTFQDIELLILTHHHPDHTGLIEEMMPGAEIAGHIKMKPWLQKDETFFERVGTFFYRLYRENGVPSEWIREIENSYQDYLDYTVKGPFHKVLSEGTSIDGLNGWQVIETPGHAQTHLSLIREKDGTMIAGDHLIAHISSNAIIEAPYSPEEARPKTLLQYRDSLKKCERASLVYSGHGERIEAPSQLIGQRIREMDEKAQVFKQRMDDRPVQVFDLCKAMYPKLYKQQTALTFSETLGHLDLLEERGEIISWSEGDKIYYKKE